MNSNVRARVERTQATYLPRVRVKMGPTNDPLAPPPGTEGVIDNVDAIGAIHITWNNGSRYCVILDDNHPEMLEFDTSEKEQDGTDLDIG